MLVLVIVVMICFLLFNIWPLWIKKGLWYCSFYLLVVLLGFIVFRASVWLFFFHFGLDIWIMPNFFNDDVSVLDSLRPIIEFSRRGDDTRMFFVRILSAITIIYLLYQFS
mmetsp:Transcript_29230/g.21763  ORF Transcript_29230/g.21763 Transcript_29230/m.21763 type:complete len:110 (+) Transcript_29230:412-741(+)